MNSFWPSFRTELRLSFRDKNPQIILFLFLILTSLSSLISWLTVRNVSQIYVTIRRLGFTKSANPFGNVSALYFVRNSVIYVILIGSLLAIILGAQASIRDRKSLTASLIKSRNVSLSSKFAGQLLAIFTILFFAIVIVSIAAYLSIWLILGHSMSGSSAIHLIIYGVLSLLLLMSISAIAFAYSFYTSTEENALLVPVIFWSAATFIVPLIVTSVRPIALLNPTPSIISGSGVPHLVQIVLSPFMVMENFKSIANSILGLDSSIKNSIHSTTDFFVFVIISLSFPFLLPRKDFGRKINV